MRKLTPFLAGLALAALPLPALAAASPVVGKDQTVTVKKGDNLFKLALKYNLALEHICFANGLKVTTQAPKAETLRIPEARIAPQAHPPNGLVVNIPERGVYVFKGGKVVAFYPIAIGVGKHLTPIGHFKIISMEKNPTWVPPAWSSIKHPVKAGPQDPLGDRWIGISYPGIGLHSTNEPESVGDDASHGCMRMYPKLAHALFEQVHKGMPVWIEYQPVKVGVDSKGHTALQVYPDVYHHNNSLALAKKILSQDKLTGNVSMTVLEKLIKHPTGVVTPAS
jgi:L,D-transpeptidase ErfK/SrfK